MTYLERLWALKRKVAAGGYPVTGICYAADLTHQQISGMQEWPEYSGQLSYPVRHPELPYRAAYYSARRNATLWCGAYGGARMRLLNWLIRQEEAKHAEQAE